MSFLGKTLSKIVGTASNISTTISSNLPGSAQAQSLLGNNSSSSPTNDSTNNATNAAASSASSPKAASLSANNSNNNSRAPRLGATGHTKHQQQNTNQDFMLTVNHLRKVFYEYLHPRATSHHHHELTQSEKDEKLYSILPLFIKAFGNYNLDDINDKFGDVNEFCLACTNLLVAEISKRVHDDLVLIKFFEIKTSEESGDGYGLFSVVSLLASGPPQLIGIMNKCSLASRLVMCVYLFLCLPEPRESILDTSELTAKEKRILFQKSFHQLLLKLCQYQSTCDELVDGDALKFLFKIISSTCETHNSAWKLTAQDALVMLSKNFTQRSIDYLHQTQSVAICLKSLEADEICVANLIEKCEQIGRAHV